MGPVHVNPDKVHEFENMDGFYRWLGAHHDREREVWIKIHKVKSGLKSIAAEDAIRAALCWGWIDGIRKSFDEKSFLQRFSPRGPRSVWSQINVDHVARLTADGKMTAHGLKQVEAAKADGRWDRAYRAKDSKMPDDLQAAIDAEPEAKAMLAKLTAQNRFALIFRIGNLKTEAGRKKKIADIVAMLKRGETIHPQKAK
ncbi:YdeI/OmpD-associated family protein [Sphingosinicella sp.]|uniref:YdeI/OmpD-associated family protein n=1 Tax=Sphingosinicella sp. TaxID=1917971 RepID=UPI0040380FCB